VLLKKSQSWAGVNIEEETMDDDTNLESKKKFEERKQETKKTIKVDASYGTLSNLLFILF
jgi:hypothetical protein